MFTWASKVCEISKSLFTYISIIHLYSVYHNVHTYISQIVEISWKNLCKRYEVCFPVYSNERYNTHDVFTCSTCFSSLYLCFFQPQRCCSGSPHINNVTTFNHSCGWDGGSVRLSMMWIRLLIQSDVRMLPWLSVVMPSGRNDLLGVEGGPVYLKRS